MPIYTTDKKKRRHGSAVVVVGDYFLTRGKSEHEYWRRHVLLLPRTFPTVAMASTKLFFPYRTSLETKKSSRSTGTG